jgi:hypothetical protein
MSCLAGVNLVGLRDACGEEIIPSSSGYWLNDLPGMELGIIAAGANKEQKNAIELITRQGALAQNTVLDMYRGQLKSRWSVNSLLQSKTTGQYRGDLTPQPAQAFRVGQFFKACGNPYAELSISSMSLYVNYTGAVPVGIYNALDGSLIDTVTFDAVAGKIVTKKVNISIQADGQDLLVYAGYDATNIPTYKTLINEFGCMHCKGGSYDLNYMQVYSRRVALSSPVIEKNLRGQTGMPGMSGLSITWGLNCSIDPLICSMGHMLAPAIMFKWGELLARQLKFSQRLSPEILYFRGDYDELSEDYRVDYERHLQQALENAIIPKGPCFKCTSPVKMRKTG